LAFHSQARTMARSNLPADGTCATSSAQSSQQKVSPTVPRGSVSSKLLSPVDGGSRPPQSAGGTGTVSTRPAERLPVYGSATSDRRSLPPDGSGSAEQRSSSSTTRPTMSASAAATAAIQVTFQDPIESKSLWHSKKLKSVAAIVKLHLKGCFTVLRFVKLSSGL